MSGFNEYGVSFGLTLIPHGRMAYYWIMFVQSQ